jgi:translation initiation factor 5
VSARRLFDNTSKPPISKKYVPKEVSKQVRLAAKPFIKWLEENQGSDSEEEE